MYISGKLSLIYSSPAPDPHWSGSPASFIALGMALCHPLKPLVFLSCVCCVISLASMALNSLRSWIVFLLI